MRVNGCLTVVGSRLLDLSLVEKLPACGGAPERGVCAQRQVVLSHLLFPDSSGSYLNWLRSDGLLYQHPQCGQVDAMPPLSSLCYLGVPWLVTAGPLTGAGPVGGNE